MPSGCTTKEDLANPTEFDDEGQRCLIAGKDGSTTELTVGRHAGLVSFTVNEVGLAGTSWIRSGSSSSTPTSTTPLAGQLENNIFGFLSTILYLHAPSSHCGNWRYSRQVPTIRPGYLSEKRAHDHRGTCGGAEGPGVRVATITTSFSVKVDLGYLSCNSQGC